MGKIDGVERIRGGICLKQSIKDIFDHNIKVLGEMDKAIFNFREQQYDKALGYIVHSFDEVRIIIEAIITDREYFNLVDTKSMLEMLTGILEAKKDKDYVLLADLLELQLVNFLIGVQELIINKEEMVFDEENYRENIDLLMQHSEGFDHHTLDQINTVQLLERGYRIEFTSCGLMTLAAENEGLKFYFHTNNKVYTEAFLLARQWYRKEVTSYILYGYGMGYHISELHKLAPDAEILIFEADVNVIQLACAFSTMNNFLDSDSVRLIYDPEFNKLKDQLQSRSESSAFYVHYPSYQNVKSSKGKEILAEGLPWLKTIEDVL
jgi:hypothetical protein